MSKAKKFIVVLYEDGRIAVKARPPQSSDCNWQEIKNTAHNRKVVKGLFNEMSVAGLYGTRGG